MSDEQTSGEVSVPDASVQAKKNYTAPTLTLFGHVAALTQGSACSAANDGITCPAAGGNGMGMASDRRLKHEIVRVGDHPAGFGLYLFSYLPAHRDRCGHGRHFGVMADEVEQVIPEAVTVGQDGFKSVHYDRLGIQSLRH
ncbi:MAG TPA: tail fiber domain-containing protein [Ramlibacter sp.]|nr:tail fiber domain-containing protein [Ramlibacter sp.]